MNYISYLFLMTLLLSNAACVENSKATDQVKQTTQVSELLIVDTLTNPFLNMDWKVAGRNKDKSSYAPFYIPKREAFKFFMVDADGEPYSEKKYNDIILDGYHPFYWVKKEGLYFLYTYPEHQVLTDGFDKPQTIDFARYRSLVALNYSSPHIFYTLDTKESKKEFRPHYFFSTDSRMVNKSRFAPLTWKSEMGCGDQLKGLPYPPRKSKHLLVFDENCKIRIIDDNGKPVSDLSIDKFEIFDDSSEYLWVETRAENGIYKFSTKEFGATEFENIQAVEGLPGYFRGFDPKDPSWKDKFIIDHRGKLIHTYTNGRMESPDGHLFINDGGTYELFDVIKKKVLFTISEDKHGPVKEIRIQDGKPYVETYDKKFFDAKGKELTKAPWPVWSMVKQDSLKGLLTTLFPDAESIVVSECIFNKYYKVTKDNLEGIIDLKGNIIIGFDDVKFFHFDGFRYVIPYMIARRNGVELLLDEDLQIIKFPQNEVYKRTKLDIYNVNFSKRGSGGFNLVNNQGGYGGYCVFQDNEYVHVFTTDGEYLSSHQGKFRRVISSFALHEKGAVDNSVNSVIIELIANTKNPTINKTYYVNVATGMEYLNK